MEERVARVDLAEINEVEATRLLQQMQPALRAIVRKHRRRYLSGLDLEDLYAIGRLAIMEALVTYQPLRGCALTSWAGRLAYWRIGEAVKQAAQPQEVELEESFDIATSVPSVESLVAAREELRLTQVALCQTANLSVRRQEIVRLRANGQTLESIAKSLGVSRPFIHREYHAALRELRACLDSANRAA